jgi:hypothetical protein
MWETDSQRLTAETPLRDLSQALTAAETGVYSMNDIFRYRPLVKSNVWHGYLISAISHINRM